MSGKVREVITVDPEKCTACHRCISVCPAKMCNDASGDYIKVNPELCIGCGRCISACHFGARQGIDDFSTWTFFECMITADPMYPSPFMNFRFLNTVPAPFSLT